MHDHSVYLVGPRFYPVLISIITFGDSGFNSILTAGDSTIEIRPRVERRLTEETSKSAMAVGSMWPMYSIQRVRGDDDNEATPTTTAEESNVE